MPESATSTLILTHKQQRIVERAAARRGITVAEYLRHREAGDKWCPRHKHWRPQVEFGGGHYCAECAADVVQCRQRQAEIRAQLRRLHEWAAPARPRRQRTPSWLKSQLF